MITITFVTFERTYLRIHSIEWTTIFIVRSINIFFRNILFHFTVVNTQAFITQENYNSLIGIAVLIHMFLFQ